MMWTHIARKDLLVEFRARDTLVPVLLTGLLLVLVGAISYHDVTERHVIAAGTLWTGLAFAAILGLARAFGSERDAGTLDTLLALPIDRGHLYFAKTTSQFVVLLLVALVLLPTYFVASGGAVPTGAGWLLIVVVLGAFGLAATGTLLSALVSQTRSRDLLLPVLALPLLVPLLVSTVHATANILAGEAFDTWRGELLILMGYDVAFAAASWLLFETAVGA